ncbi:UDP-N-acetylglucosamine acyltransferase [Methylohalomonas lacus]|uniref:Acyl-[acyl-carrier-protein]--UDP-N-acetylglucosamine O-acyltransferase n=1 Tax=Methylohalomonas lacus TaxID=398773 RepID=A0AAE3L0H7_9GAMM|nr:acyl-ACP--UDP-N-acetylglucosamine O-acyltransferase [Methylohalomonas lacus]MCS3902529.1 UDP-N-acetylglucosamine acyltransferase [Methylohalomonas lacus]
MIHATAIIDPAAQIDESADIGPYSVIGSEVEIGADTVVGSHVTITGPTRIGRNNQIYQFCSIGECPQDKKFSGEKESSLVIGDGNVIREYCSLNRGTAQGGGTTRIGNYNWIMAYVHVAHDCIVGNHNTLANNATLAGHVIIDDYVTLGGFTGIHQFCHIGSYSFMAISSVIVKDVPPYLMVAGNTARPCGLNKEGLKRHGFTVDTINAIKKAYKILYRDGLMLNQAMEKLTELAIDFDEVSRFVEFIRNSKRGVVR